MKDTMMGQDLFKKQFESFGPSTMLIGVLLLILGVAGIILPAFLSIFTVSFVASMLIIGGVLWGFHTYQSSARKLTDWLKPILLILTGFLFLMYPVSGVASLALIITFYLLLDAYGSFVLAHATYPGKGWGWMTFNGVADLVLAGLFIAGWPQASMLLVGLFVGISLFFDGWALIVVGWALRKAAKEML